MVAAWDIYAEQLLPLVYGHPLWVPEPGVAMSHLSLCTGSDKARMLYRQSETDDFNMYSRIAHDVSRSGCLLQCLDYPPQLSSADIYRLGLNHVLAQAISVGDDQTKQEEYRDTQGPTAHSSRLQRRQYPCGARLSPTTRPPFSQRGDPRHAHLFVDALSPSRAHHGCCERTDRCAEEG